MTDTDMAAELHLIASTAEQVFQAAAGRPAAEAWSLVRETELDQLALPDPGGDWLAAAAAVTRLAGEHAVELPYADAALVAGPLLAEAGLELPAGPCVAASPANANASPNPNPNAIPNPNPNAMPVDGRWRVRGTLRHVPWAAVAARIVVVAGTPDGELVASVDPSGATITPGKSMTGEPSDTVEIDTLADAALLPNASDILLRRGALARALLIAGAAEAALRGCVRYATERVQFGRPIARQQVIQHMLAEMAGEVTAVRAAADAAVGVCAAEGFGGPAAGTAVAVAKIAAGTAAEVVARLAHQVHGAIGTTREHPLHRYTLRMWAWREEFGAERAWERLLGEAALARGAWEVVTGQTSNFNPQSLYRTDRAACPAPTLPERGGQPGSGVQGRSGHQG
jgi:acyl-CoA dehydrogenase